MIIEYLPSTLKYLLGDVDSKGYKRPSTIVGGCYDSFMREIERKSIKKKGYVTFCYRDKKSLAELGGETFLASIMDDILEKVYPNMDKSNFQHLFILHDNPKHDFELNFVAAESVGGRYFPVYFDKYDRKYFEAFGRYIHKKYPKLTDPNSPELRRGLADANKYWNSSQQSLFLRLKNEMAEYGKAINNREDFERFLKQSNFIINRKTDTSITVKLGDTKIKLTGNLCNNGNTRAIGSENVDVDKLYKELSQTRYARLKNKYKYLKNYEYPEATTLDNISKTVTPIQYQMIPPFAEILMNELKNPDSQIHGVLLNGFQKIADRACAEMIEMQEEFYEKHREELNQLLKDVRTNIIKDFSQTIVKLKENLENQKINFQNLRQELCSCILDYKKNLDTIRH